jgi:hypothetical protein
VAIKSSTSARGIALYLQSLVPTLATLLRGVTAYAADGAITIKSGVASLTKSSAGAYTLAAPSAAQEGTVIHIVAGTAAAHVVTIASTSLLDGTSTAKGKATTAAYIGSGISVVAVNQKWLLLSNIAATLAAS